MKFAFIAKHRGIWAVDWMCGALGVSRGGLYGWLRRPRSRRNRSDEELGAKVRASFIGSDRTYGARRVWRDRLVPGPVPTRVSALCFSIFRALLALARTETTSIISLSLAPTLLRLGVASPNDAGSSAPDFEGNRNDITAGRGRMSCAARSRAR